MEHAVTVRLSMEKWVQRIRGEIGRSARWMYGVKTGNRLTEHCFFDGFCAYICSAEQYVFTLSGAIVPSALGVHSAVHGPFQGGFSPGTVLSSVGALFPYCFCLPHICLLSLSTQSFRCNCIFNSFCV